jgi:Neuraminidase (sialidase)
MKVTKLIIVIAFVFACISLARAQWEPDVRLSNGTYHAYTSFNHQHSLATCGDTVHAVWFDGRHGWPNAEIYYRRSLDAGVNWGPETRLTNDTHYSGYPSVAVCKQNIHITYFDSYNDDDNIHYMRSTDGGDTWSPNTQLTTNILMQDFPSIAVQDSMVHIVFHDEKDGNWEVYYLRSTDNGNTWDPEVRLTIDPDWSNNANVLARNQLVHVVWSDDRASTTHFDIYYKRSTDYGSTWGADIRLTFTLDSGTPGLAMS